VLCPYKEFAARLGDAHKAHPCVRLAAWAHYVCRSVGLETPALECLGQLVRVRQSPYAAVLVCVCPLTVSGVGLEGGVWVPVGVCGHPSLNNFSPALSTPFLSAVNPFTVTHRQCRCNTHQLDEHVVPMSTPRTTALNEGISGTSPPPVPLSLYPHHHADPPSPAPRT